jgi:hypothetical protein
MPSESRVAWADGRWVAIERHVRQELAGAYTEAAIDWIMADLKPRIVELMVKSPPADTWFPAEIKARVDEIVGKNVSASIVAMVRLEAQLYQAIFRVEPLTAEHRATQAAQTMPDRPAGSKPN